MQTYPIEHMSMLSQREKEPCEAIGPIHSSAVCQCMYVCKRPMKKKVILQSMLYCCISPFSSILLLLFQRASDEEHVSLTRKKKRERKKIDRLTYTASIGNVHA